MDGTLTLIVAPPSMAEVREAAATSAAPMLHRAAGYAVLCLAWLGAGLGAGWLAGGAWWVLALPAGIPLGFALTFLQRGRDALADGLARIDELDTFSAMETDLAQWRIARPDVVVPYLGRLQELQRPLLAQDYFRLRAFMQERSDGPQSENTHENTTGARS